MPKTLTYSTDFHYVHGDAKIADEAETFVTAVVLAEFTDLDGNEYVAFQDEYDGPVNIIAKGSRFFVGVA